MRYEFHGKLSACLDEMAQRLAVLPNNWTVEQKAKVAKWVMHTRHVIHQAFAAVETKHYAHLAQILQAEAAEEVAAGAAV